jgi:peptidoglycan/LPS O-acetylase OafA/YrhL
VFSLAGHRSYRPDIDGLRAIAILSVVLYHAGLSWLTGGFTGVDIFFVISGYLIGGHIYAELRAGAFSYREFYRRRAKRILPAFFAVLAFTLLAGLILLSPAEMTLLARSALAATLSASNFLFWGTDNYFAARSDLNPLLVTWSLGVEEQFYAVIPLGMVLVARFRFMRIRRSLILPAILVVCIASFGFAWGALANHPMAAFYLLPARAWELGVGVALAVAELNRKAGPARVWWSLAVSAAGLGLLLAPIFLLTAVTAFPGPAALPTVLGTALLIAVPGSWINRRLLALPSLAFVGRISYSWYLWHWPLLAFLRILYGAKLPVFAGMQAIGASFCAAVLSYFFIELPFRRSRRAAGSLIVRYGLASGALLMVCAALWASRGVPRRFPKLATMEAAGQALKADPCLAGYTVDEPNLSAACYPAADNQPAVALWGDSHSASLAPGLRAVASAQGHAFVELGKASCPPLIGATHSIPRIPLLAAGCERFNGKALEVLEARRDIRIVVLAAVWAAPLYRDWADGWLVANAAQANHVPTDEESRRLFVQSLAATIRSLQESGKQVVVVEDVPSFEVDPVWRVRSQLIPARRGLDLWLGVGDAADPGFAPPDDDRSIAESNALLEETASEFKGVALVDLKPAICPNPALCAYRDGQTLLYVDSSHLSADGARYALRQFRLPALTKTEK